MSTSTTPLPGWPEQLGDRIEPELASEIQAYASLLELKRRGQVDDKVFVESRLRRGVYGQRYDNGIRHDGSREQQLNYPGDPLAKGPETRWDAPGMQRIKIPFGGVTAEQLELLADLAEEYADSVVHITTRQDFQLHFVHIDDTVDIMARLAAGGITTREACGNTVRNVTACPLAGICRGETFDVTPYARACSRFLLGHPDTQDFGRKFKIAFSGCRDEACGLAHMHDMGAIAVTRTVDGAVQRGFELWVGGGLGAVPHQAVLLDAFLPVEELLPTAQAIARVFTRHGEKKIRSRARLKFLVASLGADRFRELVREERRDLSPIPVVLEETNDLSLTLSPSSPVLSDGARSGDPSDDWLPVLQASPPRMGIASAPDAGSEYARWLEGSVIAQRQPGQAAVGIPLPLGDISAIHLRRLADLLRRFSEEPIRTTVEQNFLLRSVRAADLPELYRELEELELAGPGAGTLLDITACPGTDTCKLGIASSRGLAGELRRRLLTTFWSLPEAVRELRVKISGCFNSCGQHHVADIGFYGTSRTVGRRKVPHFQVVLGGHWKGNADAFGLAIGSVPTKAAPRALSAICDLYVAERAEKEPFSEFVSRVGKARLRRLLEDFMPVPEYSKRPEYYSDWGDSREFTLGDLAAGECAGEVVEIGQLELAAAERMVFDAQVALEAAEASRAFDLAFQSMSEAVHGLLKAARLPVPPDPAEYPPLFRRELVETGLFHDRFAGGKFAAYYLEADGKSGRPDSPTGRRVVEQAQLFIEASHACFERLLNAAGGRN